MARRTKLCLCLLWLPLLAAAVIPLAAQSERVSGERRAGWVGGALTAALADLQASGLDVLFTAQLVRPEMRVREAPESEEPRRVLEELLAPHGLSVAEPVAGTLVVVLADRGGKERGALRGRVVSRATLEPVAGVEIRVLETGSRGHSGPSGAFEVAELAPGVYTLEAHSPGFVVERRDGVLIREAATAELDLVLQPATFVEDEIAVRPSRLSLLQSEPAAPLSLSRNEVQSLPHLGGDLMRTLSLLPGTAANDVSAQFHVHGGRRDEVQLVLDGQELYEAYHLKDFDNALSFVSAEELASVDLTTGAFPAHWGDRMSGVLDMTTRTPRDPRRIRLTASLLSVSAAAGGTFDEESSAWLLTGRRGSIELASKILGSENPAYWDAFAKVDRALGDRQRLRLHALGAADSLALFEDLEGEAQSVDTEYQASYLWLTHQATLGRRLWVETRASGTRIDRDRKGSEDQDDQVFEVSDRRRFTVAALAQTWGLQLSPDHSLRWGAEARSFDADYDYRNQSEIDLVLSTPLTESRSPINELRRTYRGDHWSAFVSDRSQPLEALSLELGLRFDHHTLTDDSLLSPRAALAWRLGATGVLRASWGHFYQSHRPYELPVEDGDTAFQRAERSEHWVLGWERLFGVGERFPVGAMRVELFRREIRRPRPRYENAFEPLNTFPEVEPDRLRIAPDSSQAEGVEIFLRGAAGPRADWWVNYTYSTIVDRLDGQRVRRGVDQPHALNANLHYRFAGGWSLSLAWRYHTGWPTTPVSVRVEIDEEGEEELVPVLGSLNSRRLPDYHRLDLRASRRWALRSGELHFFVDVQNVYNRKNLAGFDLELDDDEEALLITEEEWAGFFPSLGVTFEF